ncbi:MAG: hypothetical protein GWO24_16300, partial [Akkermansiaceae bacterium]|nr:hypothetical protein [Akkermansiaceae bacterium]
MEEDDWFDVFGTKYRPVKNFHESQSYVGARSWNRYLKEANRQGGKVVTLTENGLSEEVVLASPAEGRAYCQWLEGQCRETHLDEQHWIEPRFDASHPDLDAEF